MKKNQNFFQFFVSLYNTFVLSCVVVLLKFLTFIKNYYLANLLNTYYSHLILNNNSFLRIKYAFKLVMKVVYITTLIFSITFLVYLFLIIPFNLLNINILLSINRALILWFFYSLLVLFFVEDEFLSKYFAVNSFDNTRFYEYAGVPFADGHYDILSDYMATYDTQDDLSEYYVDDHIRYSLERQEFFESYYTYAELTPPLYSREEALGHPRDTEIYEHKRSDFINNDVLMDDFYLFERWKILSHQIFDRFYTIRVAKNLRIDKKNELLFYKANQRLFILDRFKFFEKQFDLKNNSFLVKNFKTLNFYFSNEILLNVALSDNLIYFFNYSKPKLTLKHRERYDFSIYLKAKPKFKNFGLLRSSSVVNFRTDFKPINDFYFNEKANSSNYDTYIFGSKILKFFDESYFIPTFSNILGFNYNLSFIKQDFLFVENNFKHSIRFLNFENVYKLSYNKKKFSKERFFLFYLNKDEIELQNDDVKYFLHNSEFNVSYWSEIQQKHYAKFFEKIFERVILFVLARLTSKNKPFKYQSVSIVNFLNTLKFLKEDPFLFNNFKVVFEKKYFRLLARYIKKLNLDLLDDSEFKVFSNLFYQSKLLNQNSFLPGQTNLYWSFKNHYRSKKKTVGLTISDKIFSLMFFNNRNERVFRIGFFNNNEVLGRLANLFRRRLATANDFLLRISLSLNEETFFFYNTVSPVQSKSSVQFPKKLNSYKLNFYRFFSLIDNIFFYILYALPSYLSDKPFVHFLKNIYPIRLEYYKYNKKALHYFDTLHNDIFYFPYLNKINKKINDKSKLLSLVLNQNEFLLKSQTWQDALISVNYKLLLKLNTYDFNHFNYEFFLLFLQSGRFKIHDNNFLKAHASLNIYFYRLSLLKFLNFRFQKVTVFDFSRHSLKNAILNFSKIKFFNKYFYEFYSLQLFSDFTPHDIEFLSTFGNQFWLFGSRGVFLDIFKLQYSLYSHFSSGYRLVGNVVGIEEFEDNFVANSHTDYFGVNISRVFSFIEQIDTWLKESVYEYDSMDMIQVYIYYITGVIFLWLWSRILYTLNADGNTMAEHIMWDLGEFEEFTDGFQLYVTDASVCETFPEIFGTTYTGQNRHLDENFMYPLPMYPFGMFPLEEWLWIDEVPYLGDKRLSLDSSFDRGDGFTSLYYHLNEVLYDSDEAENLISDFFRTDNRSGEYDLKSIVKWLSFGKINNKLPVLTGKSLNYLNYNFLKRPRNYKPFYNNKDLFVFTDHILAKKPFSKPLFSISNSFNNYLISNFEYFFHSFEPRYFAKKLEKTSGGVKRFNTLNNVIARLDHRAFLTETDWDEVTEFNNYVEENKVQPFNQPLSHARRMFIDYEDRLVYFEDKLEMIGRVLFNFLLKIRQNFFYTATSASTNTIGPADPFILTFFKSHIYNNILRSVTQYGHELGELHSDAIDSLPTYLTFLSSLSSGQRKQLLNELPDFYKLVFDNMYFFLDDPYLHNKRSAWFQSIYNNPYWIAQWPVKLNSNLFKNWLEQIMLTEPLFDIFLASNYLMKGSEYLLSTRFDLYMEVFYEAAEAEFKFAEDYDFIKHLTVTLEAAEIALFGDYLMFKETDYDRQHQLRKQTPSILKNFIRRKIIRDFYIVPLDVNYKIRGMVQDYYPREMPFYLRGLPDAYSHLFFNYAQKKYSHLFTKLNEEMRELLDFSEFDYPESLKMDHIRWSNRFNSRSFDFNAPIFNPRRFNSNSYKNGYYDDLLNLASQYIENRYNFSDRLFETASNYFWNQRLDHIHFLDYPNLEKNSDDVWFDAQEYYTAEQYRTTFWEVKSWPFINRRLSGVPVGSPPVFMFEYTAPVPELIRNRMKDYRVSTNKRFRDFVNDELPFESVQILTEEGSITFMHMFPIFTASLDWSIRIFNNFFKFFSIVPALRVIRSNRGPGDFEIRPTSLQDFWTLDTTFWTNYSKKFLTFNEALDDQFASNKYFSSNRFYSAFASFDDASSRTRLISSSINSYRFVNYMTRVINDWLIFSKVMWRDFMESSFNSYLFVHRENLTSIVFWLLFMHYLVWYPWLYFQSIIKSWIDYPMDFDDDPMYPNELDNTLSRRKYGLKYKFPEPSMNDTGQKFDDDEVNFSLNEHLLSLYTFTDFIAYEGLELNSGLAVATSSDLINYGSHLNLVLSNELIDFFTIQIPGYQFTYNLHDMFYLSLFEHKLDSLKGTLPFFRPIYIEFLNVLIGCKLSRDDLYFNYNFITDKNLKFLDASGQNNFLKYTYYFKSKKFFSDHLIDLTADEEESDEFNLSLIDSVEFSNKEVALDRFQENFRKHLADLQVPPKSIWFSYKAFFTSMDLLKFSYKYLVNNDQIALLLETEKRILHLNYGLNYLLFLGFEMGWSFLSRNGLLNTQYKCGELPLPIYLRFNRFVFDFFSQEVEAKTVTPSLTNEFIKQEQWLDTIPVEDRLVHILPEDLSLIHPYNNENIFSIEALTGQLVILKTFFSELIIKESDLTYKEVILDFHNLEFFEWYSFQLLNTFKVFGVAAEEWLSAVEESKEWLLFIDPEKHIGLPLYSEEFFRLEGNKSFFFYEFDKQFLKSFWRFYRQTWLSFGMRLYQGQANKIERSIQYTPIFNPRLRYFEGPQFPDKDFLFNQFLVRFDGIPFKRYDFSSKLQSIFNENSTTRSHISTDFFCQLMSLQYISNEVYFDAYLLLTPEGRAVNKQLMKQSQLQLYSYFNYHLIVKKTNYFFTNRLLLDLTQTEPVFSYRKKSKRASLKVLIFIIILICFTFL